MATLTMADALSKIFPDRKFGDGICLCGCGTKKNSKQIRARTKFACRTAAGQYSGADAQLKGNLIGKYRAGNALAGKVLAGWLGLDSAELAALKDTSAGTGSKAPILIEE